MVQAQNPASVQAVMDSYQALPVDAEAVRKDLDDSGPFIKQDDGKLGPDDHIKLCLIVDKHTYLAFKDKKDELNVKRLAALQAENMNEYGNCLKEAGVIHAKTN